MALWVPIRLGLLFYLYVYPHEVKCSILLQQNSKSCLIYTIFCGDTLGQFSSQQAYVPATANVYCRSIVYRDLILLFVFNLKTD